MTWKLPVLIGLGLVVVTGVVISRMMSKKKKWRAVGKISKVYIFPLKSGKYKEIPEAECTPIGLRYYTGDNKTPIRDRVFVVYNPETMTFLCGKMNAKLLQLNVEPKDGSTVMISYPEKGSIEVTLKNKFEDKKIEMWDKEKIRITDCGDAAAEWVSGIVDENKVYRIGYWPEEESWRRDISYRKLEFKVFKNMRNTYTGAYSDLSSYNMINESSVQDLNNKLEDGDKIRALDFRPNFVIEGAVPYEEDKWHFIKIGDVIFESFRPCTRCIFTTINSDTGEKNKNAEPLRTLRKYRTMKMLGESRVEASTPVMGIYAGLVQEGKIKCGDTVYVSD